jgi:uncharacterized membrane protein SpoIIM required for sporulation
VSADVKPTMPMGMSPAMVLARRRPEWHKLENLIASARGTRAARTPRAQDDPRVAEISRLYRATCADLALADAYHLPASVVAYLHDLVARAHVAFYRRRAGVLRPLLRVLWVEAPAKLARDPCLRLALITFFGVFALGIALAVWNQSYAVAFVGERGLEELREMYAHPLSQADAGGSAKTGFYIQHNVGIALQCFAGGVFAGLGSLLLLIFNGLYLGLMFGAVVHFEPAVRAHFFEFVTAHGPFELTGIALSGAAGLRMGWGLVDAGSLPRWQSLARSARQALPMMIGAAALVATAAPIEAFVSPSALPVWIKRAVAGVSALAIVAYLVGRGVLAPQRSREGET